MNWIGVERGGLMVGLIFLTRVVARFRVSQRQRAALRTPLFDAALLEAVFQPRPKDGDDPDLLAEVRDTLAHLNRQAYAEEFWSLDAQVAALDAKLGPPQKATLRRALLRLLTANDRWLQLVAAKTAADLGMSEAVPPLRAILEIGDSRADAVDLRVRSVMEESLATLTGAAG